MNQNDQHDMIDLKILYKVVINKKKILFTTVLLFTIVGLIYIFNTKKVFQASASILLPSKPKVMNSLAANDNFLSIFNNTNDSGSSNFKAFLLSRPVLDKLVEVVVEETKSKMKWPLGPSFRYKIKEFFGWPEYDVEMFRSKVRENLKLSLNVEERQDVSNVLEISFNDNDGARAENFLQLLLSASFSRMELLRLGKTQGKIDFIGKRIEEWYENLLKAEENYRKFQDNYGYFILDRESSGLISTIAKYTTEIQSLKLSIELNNLKIKEYKESLPKMEKERISSREDVKNPSIDTLRQQLTDSQLNLSSMLNSDFKENNPRVTDLKEKINLLKAQMKKEVEKIYSSTTVVNNPISQGLFDGVIQAELDNRLSEATIGVYQRILNETEEKNKSLPMRNQEFFRISRDRKTAEDLYMMFKKSLEEAKIDQQNDLKIEQVLEEPYLNPSPIKPNFTKYLFAFTAVGCLFGYIIVFLLYFFEGHVSEVNLRSILPKARFLQSTDFTKLFGSIMCGSNEGQRTLILLSNDEISLDKLKCGFNDKFTIISDSSKPEDLSNNCFIVRNAVENVNWYPLINGSNKIVIPFSEDKSKFKDAEFLSQILGELENVTVILETI
ncbi:MAG: Wzz/FepE/Etk N-terminal domain-containing protein [Candidatus Wallbacteria bacterium]|nr:Wzz/FepE/Etk N-terminal domain-containing protein [Candidatus Wallbacteria bacterium]